MEVQINNLYPTIDAYVNFMLGKKNALRYKCHLEHDGNKSNVKLNDTLPT